MTRDRIVDEARSWLGTPYQHQASLKGIGCDCLGLVRGLWRVAIGDEPEAAPPYRPDWAELGGEELLLGAARRWLIEIEVDAARPGDVLLFRMTTGVPAKHAAILSRPDHIVHAYWARSVVESALGPWWRERIAGAFQFPGVE